MSSNLTGFEKGFSISTSLGFEKGFRERSFERIGYGGKVNESVF